MNMKLKLSYEELQFWFAVAPHLLLHPERNIPLKSSAIMSIK